MKNTALKTFTTELSKIWGPLTSELTQKSKALLEELTLNCEGEDWAQDLLNKQYPDKEVFRSEEHGFILMGHVEQNGDLSPPHDHGDGWVLYSTVKGKVDMGIFHKVIKQDGQLHLVQKDAYSLNPGECSVYLPGDIHDTISREDNTLMLRLTSCDFMEEIKQGRLIKYTNNYQKWAYA